MKKVIILFLSVVIDIITASNFAIQPFPINFDQVPLSQTVVAGANVSFSCSAAIDNESAPPQFIWYCNDTELTNGDILYTGMNVSTLFISNVTEADQGEYYCIVKDWETRTKSESAKLLVYRNDYVFDNQPLNVTFNETIILQCSFDGIESGMIQWLRNGSTVDAMNERFHQLQDGSLVILHSNDTDDGEYSCVTAINGEHITLQSYEIFTMSANRNPTTEAVSLYPEISTNFIENMTIVCQIPSSLAVYNVTWIRDGNALNLAEEGFEIVDYNLLKIRDMNASSNEYKCVVYESSSDESPTTSLPLMVYKYSAPVVVHSDTTDHFICANLNVTDFSCVNGTVQTVDLYCKSVDGFPVPTVTWYHNGNKMINANVFSGTLMLNNTACDLLGTYQCVVSNEVGSKTTLFRILPYGWPNAPSTPELSGKGIILYVNWTKPVYLGGLNKSLISYEVYRHNIIEHINYATCSSSDSQCNVTVENDYYDLRSGIIETFYVNLRIAEATSLMCQGYIAPHVIQSKSSSINVNDIVEYGPPLVKLNCSNEVYASMQSIPTGSLSPQEYENNLFIRWCYANWTCTNGTGFLQQPYTKLHKNCDFMMTIPWASYSCSIKVQYEFEDFRRSPVTLQNCSSDNWNVTSHSQEPTSTVPSSLLAATNEVTSHVILIDNTIPTAAETLMLTPSQVTTFVITTSQITTSSITWSVTASQVTSTPSSIGDKSSSAADFEIVTTALSLMITLLSLMFIACAILYKWRRKQQKKNKNKSEITICVSLDSIPKAYSYIGKEDQSVCEKPNIKVADLINDLDENGGEAASIDLNNLSNEQMLKDLYRENVKQRNNKMKLNIDTVHERDSGFISGDKKRVKEEYDISALTSANCNNNVYMRSPAIQENPLIDSTNLMPSHARESVSPDGKVRYVQVACYQDHSLPIDIQSNTLLMLQHKASDTDDMCASKPPNQTLPHKCVPVSRDPFPYVPFANETNSDT